MHSGIQSFGAKFRLYVLITYNFVSYYKYWYCCMCIGNVASLMLSVEDYPPGNYNLTIEVVDVFGQIQVRSYSFFLPGECACVVIIVDILTSLSLSLSLSLFLSLSLPPPYLPSHIY